MSFSILLVKSPVSSPSLHISIILKQLWLSDSLKCIAFKGRALVIGFASGTIEKVDSTSHLVEKNLLICCQLPLNVVLLKNVSIMGLHWGLYESV